MPSPALRAAERELHAALAAAKQGDWDRARAAIERAVDRAPGSAEAHLARGRILRGAGGDLGAAIRAFRRATECETTPARRAVALKEYALALKPIGRYREAASALEQAIAITRERVASGAAGLDVQLAELLDLAGRNYAREGQLAEALDRHRESRPFYISGPQSEAAYYAREAMLLERLGRYPELFICYRYLVETDPDRALFAHPDLRRTPAAAKRLKDLLHGTNAYLAEHRFDLVASVFKAGFFFRLGRYRQAGQLLRRALDHGPEHFYAYHLFGKVQLRRKRPRQALHALEKAASLRAIYHDLARDRARALETCGEQDAALLAYAELETLWPGRIETLRRAAELRERTGHLEEAYQSFRRLAARGTVADKELLEHLADLALQLERPGEAVQHLQGAIDEVVPGTSERARLHIQHAGALAQAERAPEAITALDGLIERYEAREEPGVVRRAKLAKGRILHSQLEQADESVSIGESLLVQDPSDVDALLLCGDALKSARRFGESVGFYSRAADQRLADALLDEGVRLTEGAHYAEALGKLHEAFERSPASWEIYYCAASAYARLGETSPAARYLEAAARQQPGALALMDKDGNFERIRDEEELSSLTARLRSEYNGGKV